MGWLRSSPGPAPRCEGCLTIEELAGEQLVMGTNVEWPTLRRIFIDAFQREGQVMSVGQEASSLTGILGLVTACVGLTVCGMPRFCRDNAIAARPFITDPQVVVETQLAWRRTSINAAMHRFIRDEPEGGKGLLGEMTFALPT